MACFFSKKELSRREEFREEFGKVMARGGSGVVISSQSGHRLPALTIEQNKALATTPTEELLKLPFLQLDQVARHACPSAPLQP